MRSTHQGRTTNLPAAVHHGLLHIPFNGAEHGSVNNAGQDPQRIGPVQVDITRHILGKRRGDNNNIVGVTRLGHVLDEKIHHPPQAGIVAHEQLGDPEEDLGGLSTVQILPRIRQVQQLGDDGAALAGTFADGRGIVEAARFLEDGGLFEVGVGRVVVGGAVVFEFEFVEGLGYLGEEVVYGESFFFGHGLEGGGGWWGKELGLLLVVVVSCCLLEKRFGRALRTS